MTTHRRLLLALVAGFAFAGCAKRELPSIPGAGGHVHHAPHSGTLVELGEHAYSLEFVRDAATGRLTAYVLDAHAENFVRIKAPSFEIAAAVGGEQRPLVFKATANTVTGETVGDTSQFDAQADWLKTNGAFDAVLKELSVRESKFEQVAFNFPKGRD